MTNEKDTPATFPLIGKMATLLKFLKEKSQEGGKVLMTPERMDEAAKRLRTSKNNVYGMLGRLEKRAHLKRNSHAGVVGVEIVLNRPPAPKGDLPSAADSKSFHALAVLDREISNTQSKLNGLRAAREFLAAYFKDGD